MNKLSESNKAKLYDFLCLFEREISSQFGVFDINSPKLQKFLDEKSILIGRLNKKDTKKKSQFKYFVLYDDDKPKEYKEKGNDSVHNLLRHIRNAIAHGLVVAENRQKLSIKDKTKNGRLTLEGKIPNRLFYELLEALLSTRNNKTH